MAGEAGDVRVIYWDGGHGDESFDGREMQKRDLRKRDDQNPRSRRFSRPFLKRGRA
jgi:hypothetical protein